MPSQIHMPHLRSAAALWAAVCMAPAWAEGPPAQQSDQWGAGVAALSKTSPYRGVGSTSKLLPALMYENNLVRLLGPSLHVKLPLAGPLTMALTAQYANDGYKASDATALHGMAERKDGFWLGAKAKWKTPWVALSAELLGDASKHSGGKQLALEASKGFGMGNGMRLEPRLGLTWLDSAYVDHYFGVAPGEATAQRPAYAGRSTVNTELGLRLNAQWAPRHGLMVDAKHRFLGSGIQNSPLVGSNGASTLFVAYLYQF